MVFETESAEYFIATFSRSQNKRREKAVLKKNVI